MVGPVRPHLALPVISSSCPQLACRPRSQHFPIHFHHNSPKLLYFGVASGPFRCLARPGTACRLRCLLFRCCFHDCSFMFGSGWPHLALSVISPYCGQLAFCQRPLHFPRWFHGDFPQFRHLAVHLALSVASPAQEQHFVCVASASVFSPHVAP